MQRVGVEKAVIGCLGVLLMLSTASLAYLFPDLKGFVRTGHEQPYFKIAVLQEEPFLYANGSGYIPELLHAMNHTYRKLNDDDDDFIPFKVQPVAQWNQLLYKARNAYLQAAFGVTASSVLRNSDIWKGIHSSHPVVSFTMKVVTQNKKLIEQQNHHVIEQQNHHVIEQQHYHKHQSNLLNHAMNGFKMVVVKNSTEEQILLRNPKFQDQVEAVETLQQGLEYIHKQQDAFLVTDAGVADSIVAQMDYSDIVAICPTRKLTAGSLLHYSFFGRGADFIRFANEILKRMPNEIDALNEKYFGMIKQCLHKRK